MDKPRVIYLFGSYRCVLALRCVRVGFVLYGSLASKTQFLRRNEHEVKFSNVKTYSLRPLCAARSGGGGGGGEGTEVQSGVPPALRISRKRGSFLRPPHVRNFVKEGYFFVPRYEVWGMKIPLQSTNYTRLWCGMTPEVTGFPNLLPLLPAATAAAKQAENYNIKRYNACSRSSNVSVVIKEERCFLLKKVSFF